MLKSFQDCGCIIFFRCEKVGVRCVCLAAYLHSRPRCSPHIVIIVIIFVFSSMIIAIMAGDFTLS